ncbi:TetR family transcriptional regulator [Actinomadura sp. 7K507]|uniref:acyl-CoA-like ligand-binding transcription factor n=1 Tax=Actinomadura sp. 7K507 TaxID=2530365 RepID=UPI001047FA1E|nr:TetR family transcriptional regulator [Actinomadura sp. 7K507]TDC98400.1 TetR family transcriptional regulator [Actinomadura sp. 7K507]
MSRHEKAAKKPPQQVSIEAIEKVALELFDTRGFNETSVDDIAAAAGIARRTFFRYFESKNNILFGGFGTLLRNLEEWLESAPDDRPMFEVITDAVLRFNRVHSDGPAAHRARMRLILQTPALRANAALRHAEWMAVVARFAARRMDAPADAFGPQLAAHVSLAASNAAYEQWLRDESSDLAELVHRAFSMAPILRELEASMATGQLS